MTTTHKKAADAKRHSEEYGEIARCENTAANHEYLLLASDGNSGGRLARSADDYWADDEDSTDGMAWRVMIDAA